MPMPDAVRRAFEFDLLSENWTLMSNLAVEYGIGLFVENSELFNAAILKGKHDFLQQFKPMLSYSIRFVAGDGSNSSFLHCAIEMNDLESVRIILECWIENLNTDIADILTQRIFHATYFLQTEKDLMHLAEK